MSAPDLIGSGALWLAIPVAALAGLVSFLSPCVLPLVPGYLGFLGGTVTGGGGAVSPSGGGALVGATRSAAPTPRGRLLLAVVLFILGFSVVFIAFTIVGGAAAVFLVSWGPAITRVLGGLIIVMGLVFLGLFGFAQREVRLPLTSRAGLIGAPLLGIALGIGWTPCIGPTLTAITAVSWSLGDPWRAALLGLAYSFGLGIPFLLVALGFGWATRSIGFLRRHIRVVNILGGLLLIALGILMVAGVWTALMSQLTAVIGSVPLPL